MEKSITIAMPEEKKVSIKIEGNIKFEEFLDMIHTAELDLLTTMAEQVEDPNMKREMYRRTVQGFSLMINKFYPEGVDERMGKFTDADLLEMQTDWIKKKKKANAKS